MSDRVTDPSARNLFDVSGQIVLVSGGSRGIGRAIARGFAQQGATVVLTGRQPETVAQAAEELTEENLNVEGLVCDVTDPAAIERLVQRVLETHGQIDSLVNVAGVNRRRPALEFTEQDYDFVLDTNLKGAFLMAQLVGGGMVERRSGSQIHITSLNSDRPLLNVVPYAMSKAGLAQMTRALALEWGPYNVRVNAISPGFILTDLTESLWAQPAMQQWGLANTPLRRLGRPEDLVGTALFLASPAAAFLTGQVLTVDGGFTAGWAWPMK